MPRAKKSVAVGVAVLLAGGLATGIAQVAGAQPKPTVSQVQAQVNADQSKVDKATAQYDAAMEQLKQANARLAEVNKKIAAIQVKYNASRKKVAQIATASFQDSNATSLAGLVTTGDPSKVLNEAALILQIAGQHNMQAKAFLAQAQQFASVQDQRKRTQQGIAQVTAARQKAKNAADAALKHSQAQLSTLTAAQQAQVQANSVGGGSSASSTTSTPSVSGSAGTAIAFAKSQIGCPYVFGGTGPCNSGWDCSGLLQAAWSQAGVSIPRTTYDMWSSLPHVAMSSIQPGDLIFFDGEGHVAMYLGNDTILDAPSSGETVRELSLSNSWYQANLDGAARP